MITSKDNILAVQITKVFYPFIIAQGHDGHALFLNLSPNEQKDESFWEAMKRIFKAQLWVPMDIRSNKLVDEGWLDVSF
ncbi:MAG TPA: hypothetical protein VK118_00280 [Tetragenococcus sp.]|nr:hypothetical protein [Tetragenococcus sp.]